MNIYLLFFSALLISTFSENKHVNTCNNCSIILESCDSGNEKDKEICTLKQISNLIKSNIKYPELARENGKEGTLVFVLTVRSNGDIVNLELVHHFGQDSEKAGNRFIKRNTISRLKFKEIICEEKPKSARIIVPVHFSLKSNSPASFFSFEDIFCEPKYDREFDFNPRSKALKKRIRESSEISFMWKYKLGLTEFKAFDIKVIRNGQAIIEVAQITEISNADFAKAIQALEKKDVIEFHIKEIVKNIESKKIKRILIR